MKEDHALGPEGELVQLADDLHAAIASGEIGRAIEAHHALGERLDRADDASHTHVIDLARGRARRARA